MGQGFRIQGFSWDSKILQGFRIQGFRIQLGIQDSADSVRIQDSVGIQDSGIQCVLFEVLGFRIQQAFWDSFGIQLGFIWGSFGIQLGFISGFRCACIHNPEPRPGGRS